MKKQGFTLIELLAVIVILAIIALIAVPLVFNIISDAKEKANEVSIEMYKKSVNNAIAHYMLNNGGNVNFEDLIANISNYYEGTEVICPYMSYSKTSGKVNFGKCYTNLEDMEPFATKISGEVDIPGSEYAIKVNDTDTYNFYVLSTNDDGTTNLILNKNICSDGTYATKDNTCLIAWTDKTKVIDGHTYADISTGPIVAINYLNEATKDWDNITYDYGIYNDVNEGYSNFALTGHARLIKYSEMVNVGCNKEAFASCPIFLVNGLREDDSNEWINKYKDKVETIEGLYEYWAIDTYGFNGYNSVHYTGLLNYGPFMGANFHKSGIRPVITVPTRLLEDQTKINEYKKAFNEIVENKIKNNQEINIDTIKSQVDNPNNIICPDMEFDGDNKKVNYGKCIEYKSDTIVQKTSLSNKAGSKVAIKVNNNDVYYFHILSTNDDGTTNLIMNRNICSNGKPATKSNTCLVPWISKEDYNDDANYDTKTVVKGPITAINYLNEATSTWNNITYNYGTYTDVKNNYSNFALTGHARLPKKNELSNYSSGANNYLYNNLKYYDKVLVENNIEGIAGYYTMDTYSLKAVYSLRSAIGGKVIRAGVLNFGIRPVITIPTSLLQ